MPVCMCYVTTCSRALYAGVSCLAYCSKHTINMHGAATNAAEQHKRNMHDVDVQNTTDQGFRDTKRSRARASNIAEHLSKSKTYS